ncbi:DUF6886 family protein [Priestia taiwanensis]|uniref:Uncharacterized protein n=1 Tax=Priestia taiwanensis TaxID=1347902 RepID=A0A917ARD0_9BACI|nr:DUF6886 family protein [Priestia taiwanensis]MBM7363190.1 hypothetical protein [Priestia taiwanensis]GGE68372.1 hypothetical protein GCM10007140_18090 [Priestia taiwanensis]
MKLYHYSEEASITEFYPRPAKHWDNKEYVFAIDEEHASHYYFPRNCPRVIYWEGEATTLEDIKKFFPYTTARKVIVLENKWYGEIRKAQLYEYEFPVESFYRLDETAGYYVSEEHVCPVSMKSVGDLLTKLTERDIEVRFVPSLWEIRDALIESSVQFSIIRMSYATDRCAQSAIHRPLSTYK